MGVAKAEQGIGLERPSVAWWANDLTRFLKVVRLMTQRVRPAGHILEIGPGPGHLAIELAGRGYSVTALDINKSIVTIVRQNAATAGVEIDVQHGDASAMPFADGSFDAIVCVAVFKRFADPIRPIDEMYRVLRPGGEASIVDLRQDARREDIDAEVRNMYLSPWNSLITRWMFRSRVLSRAYSREQLERIAAQSRFGRGEVHPDGIGMELRLKKDSRIEA